MWIEPVQGEKPFIIRLRDDKNAPADTIRKYEQDFVSSDPERMKEVLSWMMSNYPADDYGLVMWGHANGWVIMDANRRALAVDTGNNSTSGTGVWLEVPDFRKVLEALPHPLKFVFADCCNVQNVEVAYELKDVTQYLIASPAAIPDDGAPYEAIIPDLFNYMTTTSCANRVVHRLSCQMWIMKTDIIFPLLQSVLIAYNNWPPQPENC